LLTSECLAAASSVFQEFFFKTQPSDAAVAGAAVAAECRVLVLNNSTRQFLAIVDQATSLNCWRSDFLDFLDFCQTWLWWPRIQPGEAFNEACTTFLKVSEIVSRHWRPFLKFCILILQQRNRKLQKSI
jgi:hypothetical protein